MTILSIQLSQAPTVPFIGIGTATSSNLPSIVFIGTDDTSATVTTAGYLNASALAAHYTFSQNQLALVYTTDLFASFYQISIAANGTITLMEFFANINSVTGTPNRITTTAGPNVVVDIAATYVGQASITTLGTITTGVWNGTNIPLGFGGTNAALVASNGGIFYSTAAAGAILAGTPTASKMLLSGASAAPTWSTSTIPTSAGAVAGKVLASDGTNYVLSTATFPVAAGAAGTILRSDGTNWLASTATFANTYAASSLLYSNGANTVTDLATSNSSTLVTSLAGVPTWLGPLTNGQIIIGSTGAIPVAATLTAGAGITITNAAGAITITNSGIAANWVDANATPVNMVADTSYAADAGALQTFNVPAVVAFGAEFQIAGFNGGNFILQMNVGQTLHLAGQATSAGGTLTATSSIYNAVKIVCVVANTTFVVISSEGTFTVA